MSEYIYLVSNTPYQGEENTCAAFTTQLASTRRYKGNWEVAVKRISYTNSIYNTPKSKLYYKINDHPGKLYTEIEGVEFPAGFYSNPGDIVNILNEIILQTVSTQFPLWETGPRYHYNAVTNKVSLYSGKVRVEETIYPIFLRLDESLEEQLGFPEEVGWQPVREISVYESESNIERLTYLTENAALVPKIIYDRLKKDISKRLNERTVEESPAVEDTQPTVTPPAGDGQPTATPVEGDGQPTATPVEGDGQPTPTAAADSPATVDSTPTPQVTSSGYVGSEPADEIGKVTPLAQEPAPPLAAESLTSSSGVVGTENVSDMSYSDIKPWLRHSAEIEYEPVEKYSEYQFVIKTPSQKLWIGSTYYWVNPDCRIAIMSVNSIEDLIAPKRPKIDKNVLVRKFEAIEPSFWQDLGRLYSWLAWDRKMNTIVGKIHPHKVASGSIFENYLEELTVPSTFADMEKITDEEIQNPETIKLYEYVSYKDDEASWFGKPTLEKFKEYVNRLSRKSRLANDDENRAYICHATHQADFRGGIYGIYAYSDIVENVLMGHVCVPLLCDVDIPPSTYDFGDQYVVDFTNIQYKPLKINEISSIRFELHLDTGELVPFQFGRTIVVLHLKKRDD